MPKTKTKPRRKPDVFWAAVRKGIREKSGKLWYGFGTSAVPGVRTIEATWADGGAPLATIWYRWISAGQIDILFAFVRPGCRRTGVMTYLHQQLRVHYPTADFTTCGGTRFGEPWMLKNGYRRRSTGDWIQRPKRTRKTQ